MKERILPITLILAFAFVLWGPPLAPARSRISDWLDHGPPAIRYAGHGIYSLSSVIVPALGFMMIFHRPGVGLEEGEAGLARFREPIDELPLSGTQPGSLLHPYELPASASRLSSDNYVLSRSGLFVKRGYGLQAVEPPLTPIRWRSPLLGAWTKSRLSGLAGSLPKSHVIMGTVGTSAELNVIGRDISEEGRHLASPVPSPRRSNSPAYDAFIKYYLKSLRKTQGAPP